jgi:soluble cytochrome b562
MTIRSLLFLAMLLALPLSLMAQDSALEGQMKILARGTKQLSLQVSDPAQQAGTITLIESLKKASAESKALIPRKTADIPAADQPKFLADYQQTMGELTDSFNRIEEAVKAGEYDKAKSLLGAIKPIKQEGHKKFQKD